MSHRKYGRRCSLSQKLQYIIFMSEEFQKDQPKLRKPNPQGETQKRKHWSQINWILWFYGFLST